MERNMELEQKDKAQKLQWAVINSSVEELCEIYDSLGDVEMSAPALGLACRFRGLEVVKCLVQKGASFDFPSTTKVEEQYNCYIGRHYGNYRTNYAMYLLKIFGDGDDLRYNLKIFCLHGMFMKKSIKDEQERELSFLSDKQRVEVLRFLLENREKIAFCPEELLFYAIYFKDIAIVKELKAKQIQLSEIRVQKMTEGAIAMDGYWFEYICLTEFLEDKDYLEVMQQIAAEFDGKPFHFTENIYEITKKRFGDVKIFEFFLANFKQEKMNKREILCGLIEIDALDALPVVEREGWLNLSRRRDEMIAYATEKHKTEALAWLLDYKNRTADFAAEQERAERKMMRELNKTISPDSVEALKKIWSYRKREDGTLVITNYKGTDIEVTVPEKIGKGIVTAIGDGAFAGAYGFNPKTYDQLAQHRKIVKVQLPKTLQSIGKGTFYKAQALCDVNIPEGVREIGEHAFEGCGVLKSITIPEEVREIGVATFANCTSLKNIRIPKKVEHIGESAFNNCKQLKEVELNKEVREIGAYSFTGCVSLKRICIPGKIERIWWRTFYNCHKLEEVKLCTGVKEIDEYAFENNCSLKNITIPDTVEEIKKGAFTGCCQLERVCICGEVKKFGALVFSDCSQLKEITVRKSIPNRILGEVFEQCPKLLICCPKGSKTETYCKKKGIPFQNDIEETLL